MKIPISRIIAYLLTACSVAFAAGCANPSGGFGASATEFPDSEKSYWPTAGWLTSAPEEQGLDGAKLDGMLKQIRAEKLDLHSIVVIRHGYIVHETYFKNQTADEKHALYSVTKSFLSALIGIAVEEGGIFGIGQEVLDFFPGTLFENPDPRKEAMTLEDLLTMRSGLAWLEADETFRELYSTVDWVKFMLDLPMADVPGTAFNYCSGCSNLLSAILQVATMKTAEEYAAEHLFPRIGIADYRWESDPAGASVGGWGLYLTPRDMAKLGLLYLRGGEWDGRQIVPADWVRESTRKHTATGGAFGYGYQWWIYPRWGAYAALGRGGQMVFVIPESDLIVVTTADMPDHDDLFELIEDFIQPALSD
ncbi:MAG: serine hydrolase [Anaerolineales bacterium]|nr:serine hydrolase [Anaerolineales bacterium]